MHPEAAAPAFTLDIRFQLLSAAVRIRCEDPTLAHCLSYLTVSALQPLDATREMPYQVLGSGSWTLFEGEDYLERADSAEDVLFLLYRRIYQRALEPFTQAGWVMLHAALVNIAGRRLLLMGDKGAGKTTLVSRLMLAGHRIEGDEMTLVRGFEVMAVARRLHLKPGTDKLLPALAGMLDTLPVAHAGDMQIRALDPRKAGFDWQLERGPINGLVWLSANHSGTTSLTPMGSFDTLQRLLQSNFNWGESRQQVMAALPPLARRGGYELQVGKGDGSLKALEKLAKTNI